MNFIRPAPGPCDDRRLTVPSGHEVVWYGWRLQAHKEGASVRLYSRPGNDISERFPAVAEAVALLPRRTLILDGELVAIGDDGRPDFHLLRTRRPAAVAWLFDVMSMDGKDLRALPWKERRGRLERVMARNKSPRLRVSEVFDNGAARLMRRSKRCNAQSCVVPGATHIQVLTPACERQNLERGKNSGPGKDCIRA